MFGSLRLMIEKLYFNKNFLFTIKRLKFFMLLVLILSLLISLICYLAIDPIKRCLYLVLSLILLTPYLSLINEVWYSYFVCMVFLRGIFVILVYFTSISKYNFYSSKFAYLIFLGLLFIPFFSINFRLSLYSLYFYNYIFLFLFLLVSLIYFINFSSYFLNYSGALRKA